MTSATLEKRVSELRDEAKDDWVGVDGQTALLVIDGIDDSSSFEDSEHRAAPLVGVEQGWKPTKRYSRYERDVRKHLETLAEWQVITDHLNHALARTIRRSREVLGTRMTAYLCGLDSDTQIQEWIMGLSQPSEVSVERLRLATQAVSIIEEWDGRDIARSWLAGRNPILGMAPLQLLRGNEPVDAGPKMLAAARAFIAGA